MEHDPLELVDHYCYHHDCHCHDVTSELPDEDKEKILIRVEELLRLIENSKKSNE